MNDFRIFSVHRPVAVSDFCRRFGANRGSLRRGGASIFGGNIASIPTTPICMYKAVLDFLHGGIGPLGGAERSRPLAQRKKKTATSSRLQHRSTLRLKYHVSTTTTGTIPYRSSSMKLLTSSNGTVLTSELYKAAPFFCLFHGFSRRIFKSASFLSHQITSRY